MILGGFSVKKLLSAFVFVLFVSGCSIYEASNQPEADQLVSQYHAAFKAKDWDTVLSFYEPSFFKQHTRVVWQRKLMQLSEQYGALKSVRQTFAKKDPRYRGDYYIFGYRLVFEKKSLNELITVFKALESNKLTIAGHVIKP